jgi:hypothetical protein
MKTASTWVQKQRKPMDHGLESLKL